MDVSPVSETNVILPSEPLECISDGIMGNNFTFQLTSSDHASLKKRSSSADRRANHNRTERTRREMLNYDFKMLAKEVPKLSNCRRPSKAQVVQASCHYIRHLKQKISAHDLELRCLGQDNDALYLQINELRQQLGLQPITPPCRPKNLDIALNTPEPMMAALECLGNDNTSPHPSDPDLEQSLPAPGNAQVGLAERRSSHLTLHPNALFTNMLGIQADQMSPHSPMGFSLGTGLMSDTCIETNPYIGLATTAANTPTSLAFPTTPQSTTPGSWAYPMPLSAQQNLVNTIAMSGFAATDGEFRNDLSGPTTPTAPGVNNGSTLFSSSLPNIHKQAVPFSQLFSMQ
ncbi:hypothetical protein H4R35_003305 [Dimargaris xerosporica]|nr:hypothetical protein H4R35_003305 [Dimargaris xerosporica]